MPIRVAWGIQHPMSGHLTLYLDVDGDLVLNTEADVGYTHRGLEKIAEYRHFIQYVPIIERACDFDSSNFALGYVRAVEALMGVEPPERAQYLRVIAAELSRIMSHLYAQALLSMTGGFETMTVWSANDRELVLDLLEMLTGARVTHTYIVPGGVRADLPKGFKERAEQVLSYLEKRIWDYYKMLFQNRTFQDRTVGVGVLSREEAIELGITGPNLRASGVDFDVRRDEPYAAYDKLDFNVVVLKEGDAYARALVRFYEIAESIKIIKQALKDLPEGPVRCRVPPTLPKGEVYTRVETGRGELGIYLVGAGGNRPYRLKISAPSFRNLMGLVHLCRDVPMGDIPVIYYSLDILLLDVDR